MGQLGEMSGQFGSVAELVQGLTNGCFLRESACSQFVEPFFEVIAQFVRDFTALARVEPQKAAQKRKVKLKFLFRHSR